MSLYLYAFFAYVVSTSRIPISTNLSIIFEIELALDGYIYSNIKTINIYETIDDIEVAVNDIIDPLKKENEKLVKKYTTYASAKKVSQSVLDALLLSDKELEFKIPVKNYVVTSRYGWRRSGFHTGIDYAATYGTPIYAAEDGVVTCAQWSGNYGYLVKIQHSGGFETRYAHCSRFAVSVGDEVKKGDVISYVGSTGNSTGPHVHLEIRYQGKSIDPETLIK